MMDKYLSILRTSIKVETCNVTPTMTQCRLEALLIAAVERDLLIGLSDTDLVERFARVSDRKCCCFDISIVT